MSMLCKESQFDLDMTLLVVVFGQLQNSWRGRSAPVVCATLAPTSNYLNNYLYAPGDL